MVTEVTSNICTNSKYNLLSKIKGLAQANRLVQTIHNEFIKNNNIQ